MFRDKECTCSDGICGRVACVPWRYRDGAAVEGTPSWETVVNGIALTVRRAITPAGIEYWWAASQPPEHRSSLWEVLPGLRTYLILETAQRRAIEFARQEAPWVRS